MHFIDRLLGRGGRSHPAGAAVPAPTGRDATRRELISMAVRDTLRKNGIPHEWVGVETGPAATARKERGMHLRLVVRHWHAALPGCVVALQRSVSARVARLDPLSCEWLVGISWKFEPADDSHCPALPEPQYWRAERPQRGEAAGRQRAAADARERLKRLLASRDEAFPARAGTAADFSPTQPMLMPGSHA